jgi:hypothetical protein
MCLFTTVFSAAELDHLVAPLVFVHFRETIGKTIRNPAIARNGKEQTG